MDIIKKLNSMRLERKLSVYRLSELSGVNQSTLANTFSRGKTPSIETLLLVCETMGVSPSEFFNEDEKTVILTMEELDFYTDYQKLPDKMKKSLHALVKECAKYDL